MNLKELFTEVKNPYEAKYLSSIKTWLRYKYGIDLKVEKLKNRTRGTMQVGTGIMQITQELDWATFIHVLLHEIGHARMTKLKEVDSFLVHATGLDTEARIGEKTQEREVSLFAMGIVLHAAREFSSDAKMLESVYKVFEKSSKSSKQYNGSNKYKTEFREGFEIKTVLDSQKRTRTENVRSILVMNNILEFIREVS